MLKTSDKRIYLACGHTDLRLGKTSLFRLHGIEGKQQINVIDRNGSFEPQVISKRRTHTDEIETRIVAI